MNRDIRTMLQEKAEEVRLEPGIPAGMVKRARRRRMVTATLAGAVTVAAVAGFYAGARALLDEESGPPPGQEVQPAAPPTAAAGIFPSTEEEIRSIQSQVAEGHMPLWRSPEGVAQLYAVNVLGWDPEDVEVRVPGDVPVTAVIANPTLADAAGLGSDGETYLRMSRVPNDEGGIYVVDRAEGYVIFLSSPGFDETVTPGGTLLFSGGLGRPVPGLTVDLGVQWEDGSTGTAVAGTSGFHLNFLLRNDIETHPVAVVTVRDASGRALAVTEFRLGLVDGGSTVPEAVTTTRDAIEEAARLRDWETLERLIPNTGFTHSFGGETDAIAYYQDREREGEPVLDILATLLELAPGRTRGTYIWPTPAAENPEDWDQFDIDVLRLTNSVSDIQLFQRLGLYVGWRVGIEPGGTWVFFVAGD